MIVEDALNRMDEVLGQEELPDAAKGKKVKDASVELKDVTFAYDDTKQNAIDGVSIEIPAGAHVALVGPSGGGKTTLASLIARFWDVKSGSITIGGVNVKEINTADLMNLVSYVFQDSKLLKMSILENVRMGRPDATDEEVVEALKNAPILILDEATAFADPDNERLVQQAFENLSKDKTVIMIAHRLSTVTNADQIYVLKDGKIAESGTHERLLKTDGIYSHMWSEYNKSVNWQVQRGGAD